MPNSSIDTFLNKLGNQAGDMDRAALRDWLAGLSSVARRAGQASPRDDLAALAEKLGSVDEALLDDLAAGLAQLPPQSPTAAPPDAGTQADRIKALRRDMKAARIDAFLVPRSDRFQGEQVPPGDERLAWLTGFTGSAGICVVTAKAAAVIVDGRYTLQVRDQSNGEVFTFPEYGGNTVSDFVTATLGKGDVVGYDPWLHTDAAIRRLKTALEARGIDLKPVDGNPVDRIWQAEQGGQPAEPLGVFSVYQADLAGESARDKCQRLAEKLQQDNCAAHFLGQPDGIAWLLNIRGCDVPNSPLPLSFAVLKDDGDVALFCDQRKLTRAVRSHLGNHVELHEEGALADWLADFSKKLKGRRVSIAPGSTPQAVVEVLKAAKAELKRQTDQVEVAKSVKNATEQQGMRNAHLRDGVAITRFLHWLETAAVGEGATELTAVAKLRDFRRDVDGYTDDSFDAIAGMGAHGAIVHYRATEATDIPLAEDALFLIDSGGQYPDGTTDITRTAAIGHPSPQMCVHYTLVLKAHLAVAMARFPKGTNGAAIDAVARQPLWQRGLDFDHGTGHGVGCFLNVHEGPQRISKASNDHALEPGVILSNEPGYYRTGEYGIRIENLVLVQPAPSPGDEREMYGFETLTLAPYDRHLIVAEMLSPEEQGWIDAYHARVYDLIAPHLNDDLRHWLAIATQPV